MTPAFALYLADRIYEDQLSALAAAPTPANYAVSTRRYWSRNYAATFRRLRRVADIAEYNAYYFDPTALPRTP